VELRLAATHACDGPQENREVLDCDDATITYVTGGSYQVVWKDGRPDEQGMADRRHLLQENLRAYFAYVRGEAPRPLTRLSDSRPFVHLNALAYLAAGAITRVGEPHVRRYAASSNSGGGEFVAIAGVREAAETFAATGRFPSKQGAAWAAAPGAFGSDGPARPRTCRACSTWCAAWPPKPDEPVCRKGSFACKLPETARRIGRPLPNSAGRGRAGGGWAAPSANPRSRAT
jgi:hypothetical protein